MATAGSFYPLKQLEMGEATEAEQPEAQAQTLAMRSPLLAARALKGPRQRGRIPGWGSLAEHLTAFPDFRIAKLSSCKDKELISLHKG